MLVRMTVPCCDFTDVRYPGGVEGGGYIARGATGRWCIVMFAGPEQVAKHVADGGVVFNCYYDGDNCRFNLAKIVATEEAAMRWVKETKRDEYNWREYVEYKVEGIK